MIIIECDTDKYFIQSLGFSKNQIKHEGGKGDVIRCVGKNLSCFGIVDEDPDSSQPSEMQNYRSIAKEGTITLFERRDNPAKKIIQISPNLENWFIDRARKNQINIHTYDLKDTFEALHIPHIEKHKNFQDFLKKLIEVDEEVKIIRRWLKDNT
jgi:hypothetical protein